MVRLLLISVLFLITSVFPNAVGQTVSDIQMGFDGRTTRVVIFTDQDADYRQFTLNSGGLRYVLDFDRLEWAIPNQPTFKGEGLGAGSIHRYRFAHRSDSESRLVFDLDEPVKLVSAFTYEPDLSEPRYRIVLDFRRVNSAEFETARTQTSNSIKGIRVEDTRSAEAAASERSRTLPVIVIDAGHGGRDPGAIGLRGAYEKSVNLNAAVLLRDTLEGVGRYKVVMTRESDVFVPFEERIEIARNAGADLFISIHADAAGSRAVRGASVYTLSSSADGRAERVREEKGWDIPLEIDPQPDDVTDIMEDLVTRETQSKSAAFAQILIPELKKSGPILRNTHRQANFFVLLAPDVPAVLLEVGFLTNPSDEARLTDERELKKSMAAVHRAIDSYFEQQERLVAKYGG